MNVLAVKFIFSKGFTANAGFGGPDSVLPAADALVLEVKSSGKRALVPTIGVAPIEAAKNWKGSVTLLVGTKAAALRLIFSPVSITIDPAAFFLRFLFFLFFFLAGYSVVAPSALPS